MPIRFSVLDHILEKEKTENVSKRIKNPKNRIQKEVRLAELEDLQEDEELHRDKTWELKRLRQQVRRPTLRQKLFGFQPGRLSEEDEEYLQAQTSAQSMLKLIKG